MHTRRSARLLLIIAILPILVACGRERPTGAGAYLPTLTLAPTDVVLQYDQGVRMNWRAGQEQPFGHVPPFTLFADGTVVYTHTDGVLSGHLSAIEMQVLVEKVLGLGFARLATDIDGCRVLDNGVEQCRSERADNIIRLRLASGVLHEITINGYDGPDAMMAITDLLDNYHHPESQPYQSTHATVLVEQGTAPFIMSRPAPPEQIPAWPLAADWLAPLGEDVRLVVGIVDGQELQTMLNASSVIGGVGSFVLGATFRGGSEQFYGVSVVPWLPGRDYRDAIAAFAQRPGVAAPAGMFPNTTPVP